MLRVTGYILKNFLQDFKHEKFPATGRSHGRVGFHALMFLFIRFKAHGCFVEAMKVVIIHH